MKQITTLCLLSLALVTASAQDIQMGVNKVAKGYEYGNTPFPEGMMVFQLDKSKHYLKAEGVTLIQVWTLRDGARPELWQKAREIEKAYKDQGLTTLSVNFENGSSFSRQLSDLNDFFKYVERPENLYFDPMGYVTDMLKVPGFPIYYMVDDKGNIIFKTLGEDEEGVATLETEIAALLSAKSKDKG